MDSRNMKTSRKSTGAASRKSSLHSDDFSFGLKELNKGSKRSATPKSKAAAEPKSAKRSRGAEKDETPMHANMDDSPVNLKLQDSPDSPDVSSIIKGLDTRRVVDRRSVDKTSRDTLCKQIDELGDFVKDLCADRRRAARETSKEQSTMPFSEKSKEEALQACDDQLMKERNKLQQIFGKLQDAFQESQSMVDQYKAKIREIRSQEEKDLAWVKQLEKSADEQLNELLASALKSKGKKHY
jgi:hypothetical protein